MNGSRDIIPFGDEKKAIDDDGWDNVSISSTETIEVANCSQRLRGFFLRLFLSLLVVGACAGALIWSFVNGEAGIYVHERNASVNFSIFVDEYSVKEGTYSLTFRTPDSSKGGLQTPKIYPSFWYQDNTNSRLVHQVDMDTVIFAFSEFSFWVRYTNGNISSCDFDASTSYSSYIDRLGLTRLKRHHSAIEGETDFDDRPRPGRPQSLDNSSLLTAIKKDPEEETHHHKEVFIYDGDPDSVVLRGSNQTSFLVTAYADAGNGALLGWDTFFTSISSSDLYQLSYWYDSMLPASPDPTWFDPPSLCQPSSTHSNRVPK